MRNCILFIVLTLSVFAASAQKTIEKQWDRAEVDTLLIDSDAIYRISISSGPGEYISLTARVEGEYSESVVVNSVLKGRMLAVTSGFGPYFEKDNDKLAAHKVLSLEAELDIPEGLVVIVRSALATVEHSGSLRELQVSLSEGNILLDKFTGDARLFTELGDIQVNAGPNVGGRGISGEGNVVNELSLQGKFFIEAESRKGNVLLKKANQP